MNREEIISKIRKDFKDKDLDKCVICREEIEKDWGCEFQGCHFFELGDEIKYFVDWIEQLESKLNKIDGM